MFRQEEKSRGLMYVQFPTRKRICNVNHRYAWGHHNRVISSNDKFDMKASMKNSFLPPPPFPRSIYPRGASHPIPQGDPFERSWRGAFGLEAGRPLRGNVKK